MVVVVVVVVGVGYIEYMLPGRLPLFSSYHPICSYEDLNYNIALIHIHTPTPQAKIITTIA